MVSCLAKRVKYQLLQGETIFRTVVCLDSLDSLDMFICCTGIRLLVEEHKMTGTVFSWLDYPWKFVCVSLQLFPVGKFLPTNLPLTSPIGPFVQRCGARQYLAHAFSELNQKNSPKCMQISSKCTYIFDAGFCSLLWHNMQKPLYVCLRWRQKKQNMQKINSKNHALLGWMQR